MKRQGQIVAATITNFEAVEKALANMENSAGSAEAEMETIRQSAEYALNAFQETFTSLAQHSVDRGGLKDLINAGTAILEIVDGIVSKIGLIPAIISTIVGIMSAKKLTSGGIFSRNEDGKLTFLGSQVSGGFKSWLSGLGKSTPEIKAQRVEIQSATSAVENFHKAFQNGTMTQQVYNNVLNNSNRIVRDYGNAIKNGATEADAYTAANKRINKELQNIGKSGKVAAIGIKALNTAASMAISMGISVALNAIFKAISDGINSIENHISKIKELTDTEKSLKSETESLNNELSTTKLRIAELEKMPKLTLMEQEELNKLKETNDELERQIRLKNGELNKAASEKNKEAQNLWNEINTSSSNKWNWWNFIPGAGHLIDSIIDINNASKGNNWKQQTDDLENYKKKLEELNKIKETEEYKNGSDKLNKQVEERQKELDDLHDKIQGYYNDTWSTLKNGLDPNIISNQEIIKKIDAVINEWDKINDKSDKTLTDLYNNSKFATVKQYLDDLAKKGELTAEKFDKLTDNEVKGIEEFKKALESIPGADTKSVIESIIVAVNKAGESAENASKKFKTFAESLDTLKDKIDDIISKQNKLAEAFKKTGLGASLSAEEIFELAKELPDIVKYIEKTNDGFTISQEGFSQVNKKLYESMQNQINGLESDKKEQIQLLKDIKALYGDKSKQDEYKELIAQYSKKYDFLSEEKLGINIDDIIKGVEGEIEGYGVLRQLMNDIFDEKKAAVDAINEGLKTVSEEVDTFNKDIKTLDDAIKSLNDGTLLTYEEMNAIVEISPELQNSFVQQEHGYSIVTSALEDLRKQSYETRNKYIDDRIAEIQTDIKAAEKNQKLYQEKIRYLYEYGNTAENYAKKVQLESSLAASTASIEELKKAIERLEAMRGDLTSADDNNNVKDENQELIDYYNSIISAIEIVRDKYTEAIDKEIDALNDGKDALKEANDERQRELDLIEARNNLENAKKRKVWVYSEANGFQQVQDEKAVREAEEKYRDAIQDVQEAEIDKQIDALEKKKEEIEERVKDLTELEENINNSATVAEALKTLGLSDEKDLMSLSDSVKQGIKEGLAEAIVNKNNEDNKDNDKYTPVTLDDVLSNLGAKVTSADIEKLGIITKKDFDSAVKNFADSLKEYQEANVSNVTNNNSGMVVSPTFNISGVTDPEEVAKVVNSEMTNLFTKLNNSIK